MIHVALQHLVVEAWVLLVKKKKKKVVWNFDAYSKGWAFNWLHSSESEYNAALN